MSDQTLPINQREAESRRIERFKPQGRTAGQIQSPTCAPSP